MSDDERTFTGSSGPDGTDQARGHGGRHDDKEMVRREGGPLQFGGEPARGEVIAGRSAADWNQDPDRKPPVVRVRRSFLLWLIGLLMAAVLAVVALVVLRPGQTKAVEAKAVTTPSVNAARTSPSPGATSPSPSASSAASPVATTASSPGATATPGATTTAVAPAGGPAGSAVANLSALTALQTSGNIGQLSSGPQQIGTVTYPDSVSFSCDDTGSIIYDVATYKFLTAQIGLPSNAANAAGNTMTITFFGDGSTQLSRPVTVSLDHPQSVHLNLQGSSQLEIECNGSTNNWMDVALGNATIGPS